MDEQPRRQIGVLGGTFDPIHLAHLRLAEEAREQLGLDRVLFVPAPQPWRKAGRAITPIAHRVAMVRLAIAGNPAFDLSTIELCRTGPTYTAETLTALQAALGADVQLHFILGADALLDLPNWYQPERIVAIARLAVTRRPGLALPNLSEIASPVPNLPDAVERIHMPQFDISSTDLRARCAAGRSLRYLVPDAVADFIHDRGLYRPDGWQ